MVLNLSGVGAVLQRDENSNDSLTHTLKYSATSMPGDLGQVPIHWSGTHFGTYEGTLPDVNVRSTSYFAHR
jgi:hypothetical protein